MSRALRATCAGILIFVGVVVLPLGNLGVWVQRQVLDASAFNDLALKVVDEPAVRGALAERIVSELVVAEPRLDAARVVLEPGVAQLLRTGPFRAVFSTAVSGMHTQLEDGADELSLDLDPILPLIRDAVARIDAGVAAGIPGAEALPSITVITRDDAPELWEAVQITREASWAFPVLVLFALIGAVAVANVRGRMLVGLGIAVALLAFVQILVVRLGRDLLSDTAGPNVSRAAFHQGYDVVTGTFVVQTVVLAIVGLLTAIAGTLLLVRRPRRAVPTHLT